MNKINFKTVIPPKLGPIIYVECPSAYHIYMGVVALSHAPFSNHLHLLKIFALS